MIPTTVLRPNLPAGRRVIAVSDIHGNLPFFKGLLEKVRFSPDDILVLVGDMLEKGQHSLDLLRYIMALSKTHTVYPVCGNCDGLVLRFFENLSWVPEFFSVYLPAHPECTLRQMAAEIGFENWRDLDALREALSEAFPDILDWLKSLPIVLETDTVVFVHGGVPSLDRMEELDAWKCMKNDNFWRQGHTFPKPMVVGHWPVTLYFPDIPSAAPIIDLEHNIISIDGGCVLKADGQLNALIIPDLAHPTFAWEAYDGLPSVYALDHQDANDNSLNIRWGRSRLELLEPGEEFSLCRHLESGRVLPILTHYLREDAKGLWCEDSTDYRLPVEPGDKLKLVFSTSQGHLCKKLGVTGWYCGRIQDTLSVLPLERLV